MTSAYTFALKRRWKFGVDYSTANPPILTKLTVENHNEKPLESTASIYIVHTRRSLTASIFNPLTVPSQRETHMSQTLRIVCQPHLRNITLNHFPVSRASMWCPVLSEGSEGVPCSAVFRVPPGRTEGELEWAVGITGLERRDWAEKGFVRFRWSWVKTTSFHRMSSSSEIVAMPFIYKISCNIMQP